MTNSEQGSVDWAEQYDTAVYNGWEYPEPGDWWLDEAGGEGVIWNYGVPRTGDGDPDFTVSWDTEIAHLTGDFGNPYEELTLAIEGQTAFTVLVEDRGEGRHSPWSRLEPVWQSVAEALHQFHIDEDPTAVDCDDLIGRREVGLGDFDG